MAGIEIPVSPERHQILVTEPVDPIQGPMVMSSLEHLLLRLRMGVYHGMGGSGGVEGGTESRRLAFLEEMPLPAAASTPAAEARVLRQWSGLYENTPDRQPIYQSVPQVRAVPRLRFSGHGFMLSP
jgi:sarcosine oxidase subunit beta